jgi:predicted NBD/HSP70 family sugar kinase
MSGEAIGEVLAGIINFINPSLVVVGGGVSRSGQRLIATIKETILSKSTPLATSTLDVIPSTLGGMAGVIGAAALVVDEVFSHERVFEMVNQEGMA